MDGNLMIILTATLAVTSALSLVVFLNLLFMKIQWNDDKFKSVVESKGHTITSLDTIFWRP